MLAVSLSPSLSAAGHYLRYPYWLLHIWSFGLSSQSAVVNLYVSDLSVRKEKLQLLHINYIWSFMVNLLNHKNMYRVLGLLGVTLQGWRARSSHIKEKDATQTSSSKNDLWQWRSEQVLKNKNKAFQVVFQVVFPTVIQL